MWNDWKAVEKSLFIHSVTGQSLAIRPELIFLKQKERKKKLAKLEVIIELLNDSTMVGYQPPFKLYTGLDLNVEY